MKVKRFRPFIGAYARRFKNVFVPRKAIPMSRSAMVDLFLAGVWRYRKDSHDEI